MSFDGSGDYIAESTVRLEDVRQALTQESGGNFPVPPFERVSLEVAVACLHFAEWLGHDMLYPEFRDGIAMAASDATDGRLNPVLNQLP